MLLNKEGGRGRAVEEKEGGVDVGYLRVCRLSINYARDKTTSVSSPTPISDKLLSAGLSSGRSCHQQSA
jgi:hypothetical protein